jgi:integrase
MPRKATGQVIPPGPRRASWGIRFRAYGRRHFVALGTPEEGWDRKRAEDELRHVLADVERGIWRPYEPPAPPVPQSPPTFHEFADGWFDGLRHEGLSEATLANYRWQLENHLLPFFGSHELGQITIAEVDRYRQAKVRDGRLAPHSINTTITRLAQILDVAVERELIDRNPARGRRRRLRQRKPQRTWLDRADLISDLLAAAGELDGEARIDRRATPRRALLAALAFAGLRISEALVLRWRDVDLAAGRLRVGRAKTDAGVREVDILPVLRDELLTHRVKAAFRGVDDFVFPTESGGRANPSNVRNRILARSIERANEKRAERDLPPLPEGLTPHSLRRTFISLLLAIGEDVPYVMRQVGHANPTVTLAVYAQVMFRAEGERERLRALVEGADWARTGTERSQRAFPPGAGTIAGLSDSSALQGREEMGDPGLEPGTSSLSERRSNRLS